VPILKPFENSGVFCCGSGGILRCVLRWICTKTWLCFDYAAEHGVFSGKAGIMVTGGVVLCLFLKHTERFGSLEAVTGLILDCLSGANLITTITD